MIPFLTTFGLDKKEAQLYYASLQIGENSVAVLAKNAGINRSTAYVLLEKLVEKRFFIEGFKFGKKTFRPLTPKEVKAKLKRDQDRFAKKINHWEAKIPELEAVTLRSFSEPKVRFYRGEDGMSKIYDEALKQKFFHGMIDVNHMKSDLLEHYFWRVGETFMKAPFPCYDIVTDGERGREYKRRYETKLFQIKLAPALVDLHADLFCFQESFSMISLDDDDFLILNVESINLAKMQLMFYKSLWESL